ncbi:hypothetical protein E8E13_005744 [Curvularia kusanoi]|uniref:J domain-containing protein n=1 Tax=Curvularia kusanoi TaxID=90978 RepID=A0A9P4W9T0_CURKU|nr:hypothetical protein E8E13_005744 [Curvularia kusanoi]
MLDKPESLDELWLNLACQTPLPRSSAAVPSAHNPSISKPYTRSQAKLQQLPDICPNLPDTPRRKRVRKSEFEIFVDFNSIHNTANTTAAPSPKKHKATGPTPLSINTNCVNIPQTVTPQDQDTPFPFSPLDPFWEDVENYDTSSFYMTPPPTPGNQSPSLSSTPTSASSARTSRLLRRRKPAQSQLTAPKDEVLYKVLKLSDWRATKEEIRTAYHKIAIDNHPDKVIEQQREDATHMMQTVNAAKEVLLDDRRRKAYHNSGKLPWSV